MQTPVHTLLRAALVAGLASATLAGAAGPKSGPGPSTAELAACQQSHPSQDLEACLKEGRAVRAAERRGELNTPANFAANRSLRCEALRGDDHNDCLARMRGEGTVCGSVEGGGLLRELVTEVPGR